MYRYRFIFFLICLSGQLFAQLSPGDLINSHASLEGLKNCTKCHEIGKKVSAEKCLQCHTLLNERIKAGVGLHSSGEFEQCENCHSDHQGKDFDPIWWEQGQENFDHSRTGYTLTGRHGDLKCNDCHRAANIQNKQKYISKNKDRDRTFLGLSQACLTCHIDEHRAQLSTECKNCHYNESWKTAPGFKHDQTRFPLIGAHNKVECQKCHLLITDDQYAEDTSYLKFTKLKFSSCQNCHADPHGNKFGSRCENCHTVSSWKKYNLTRFDHGQTLYPLEGKHAGLNCESCHLPGKSKKISSFKTCTNCHRDYHSGQFKHRKGGGMCEECHSVNGFIPPNFTIEEHQATRYPLQGAHFAVPCNLCHIKSFQGTQRFSFKSLDCVACHSDPHGEEISSFLTLISEDRNKSGCEFCHSLENWQSVYFNHKKTDFPLLGKHEKAACRSCHFDTEIGPSQPNLRFRELSSECFSCHDDIHLLQFAEKRMFPEGQLSVTDCGKCHTPLDWLAEKFEHNRDARFKLEGAHRVLQCSKCHKIEIQSNKKIVRYKPLNTTCNACHAKREKINEQ